MLKKLLKYDFKAMLKFWWIAAAINLVLSIFSGLCNLIESYDFWLAEVVAAFVNLSLFFVNCSYVGLVIVSFVLIFIRFYHNFFSDEGYLTFTLPVKRSQLLNSKVISGIGMVLASLLVDGINLTIMELISYGLDWPEYAFFDDYLVDGLNTMGPYFWVCVLELLVLALAVVVLAVVLLYFCITFGAMIVKKGKLIISIILCYGICSLLVGIGFFGVVFYFLGAALIYPVEFAISANPGPMMALVLLGLIFYAGALSGLLYSLQYGMLDRKLNLS